MYDAAQEKLLVQTSKKLLVDNLSGTPAELVSTVSEAIRYHEWKYYVQNNPVISDYEYDQLYKKLEALENAMLALALLALMGLFVSGRIPKRALATPDDDAGEEVMSS